MEGVVLLSAMGTILELQYKEKVHSSWLIARGITAMNHELWTMIYEHALIQIIQLHFKVFQHTAVGAEKCDADAKNDQYKKE